MPRKRHSSKRLGNDSFRNNLKVPEDKGHALDYKLFLLVFNYPPAAHGQWLCTQFMV